MSFQAVTWAIEQKTGSPSAKAVLWSLANYANSLWCAYPYQETISEDSEQSVDSVGRRIGDLVDAGLVRRIKLKRFGRRTHDFLILQPSELFSAPLDDIRPHLPSGCDVMDDGKRSFRRTYAVERGDGMRCPP
jgi:Helix-turn-helix domain